MLLVLFESAIDRDCWFAQFVVSNCLQQPLTGVRAQWGVDQFCGGLWASVDDREVPLAHGPFFKLLSPAANGRLVLGRHHNAAGVAVEPMHDARSSMILADLGEFTTTSVWKCHAKALTKVPD